MDALPKTIQVPVLFFVSDYVIIFFSEVTNDVY